MRQKPVAGALGFSQVAPGAIRRRYIEAASHVLLAPFPTLYKDRLVVLIAIAAIWLVLTWQFDRWRHGPDFQTIWKVERTFLRSTGLFTYFLGFAWMFFLWLFVESALHDVIKMSIATGLLLALAAGAACQGLWLSYKLRSGVRGDSGSF